MVDVYGSIRENAPTIEPSEPQLQTARPPRKFALIPPPVLALAVLLLLGDALFSEVTRVWGPPKGDMPLPAVARRRPPRSSGRMAEFPAA